MRFMILVKADKDTEAGVMPERAAAHRDGQVQRRAGEGRRHAGRRGAAAQLEGRPRALLRRQADVIDGPFAETKELIAGFWIWQVQVVAGGDRLGQALPQSDAGDESEIEIRQVFEAEDFGAEFTPELREQEERLRAQIARQTQS